MVLFITHIEDAQNDIPEVFNDETVENGTLFYLFVQLYFSFFICYLSLRFEIHFHLPKFAEFCFHFASFVFFFFFVFGFNWFMILAFVTIFTAIDVKLQLSSRYFIEQW